MADWFTETLHPQVAQRLRMNRAVFRDSGGLQDVVIFDNERFGRVLALDGIVQVTTGDEFVYHEMLTHVPILAHGAARRVLIIGGGDGGCLRRCLMHPLDTVTMVEIDRSVVDLCTQYMPEISAGAFDDPRAELVIADGAAFVKAPPAPYDVIIVDSTDPMGPGAVLFTEAFYADCRRCLTPGGILVNQAGVPSVQPEELTAIATALRASFADVTAYLASVPTYYGGFITLGWASDDPEKRRVPVDALRWRFDAVGPETSYYTPEVHAAAFALPRWVQDLVAAR